jgi:hypothetical protein
MAGPKKDWIAAVELIADEQYPEWRELFQATNRRLPPEMRRAFEPRSAWLISRSVLIKALLGWLDASTDADVVSEISTRLDAALEFVVFVTREFLLRNYSPEKHQSDVFDQFQLEYLAVDRFVIVSGDPDLIVRTRQSSQAPRIMTFDHFLGTI